MSTRARNTKVVGGEIPAADAELHQQIQDTQIIEDAKGEGDPKESATDQVVDVIEEMAEKTQPDIIPEEKKDEEKKPDHKELTHNLTTTVTTTVISSSATLPEEDQSLVKIEIKYPDEYKGKRYMKEGEHKVSDEVANNLVRKGIAKKV